MVLFHGWGFESSIWNSLAQDLADDYTLYLVDLPGFGQTKMMNWHEFVSALRVFLPAKFHLLGWSLGSLFATKLAIEQPECVEKLINVAASPRFIVDTDWPGIHTEVFDRFYSNILSEPDKIIRQFIQLQSKGLPQIPYYAKHSSAAALKSGLDILKNWDLREDLTSLSMPVAYVFGRLDAITTQRTYSKMQTAYPQFHYELFKKAGHMPFISHSSDFIQFLKRFIQ